MIDKLILPGEVPALLEQAPRLEYSNDISDLEELSCNRKDRQSCNVSYTLPDGRTIHEASVVRVKNGISANYTDPYMRRRDPYCMFIADGGRTDKPLCAERFGYDFAELRLETFQWRARDYLVIRGHARFLSDQLVPARSPLLGYALESMRIEGALIPVWLLQTETQSEVGTTAYDEGARRLRQFFHEQITTFLEPDLNAIGRQSIECCLSDGSVYDYEQLLGLSDE